MLRPLMIATLVAALGCGGGAQPVPTRPPTQPDPTQPPIDPPIATPVPAPAPVQVPDELSALRAAILGIDPASPVLVERAIKAIERAGELKLAAVLPAFDQLLAQTPGKQILAAQIAAARTVPKLGADPKAAIEALSRPLIYTFPKPDKTNHDEVARYYALAGASLNALAVIADPRAIDPILSMVWQVPALFTQARRALVASGPEARIEIVKVLRGESQVNQVIKKLRLDLYCENDDPNACEKTSIRDFYAAALLGDFHDSTASLELWKVIEQPSLPAYYIDGVPGPSQHAAAFDSLRKLGSSVIAPKVHALIKNGRASLEDRTHAAAVFAYVSHDKKGINDLGVIAADNAADDGLRQAAADSFARLSRDRSDVSLLMSLAAKYLDASAKKTTEASTKTDREQKLALHAAKAYLGYARMFQTHVARIEVAVRCKDDERCYAQTLDLDPDGAAKGVEKYIKDVGSWTADEKAGLVEANIDRAMLELGKRGRVASDWVVTKLLEHVGSGNRITRQAILLALPKIVKLPCPRCVDELDVVIEKDRGKSTHEALRIETEVVRNYLRWAGSKS